MLGACGGAGDSAHSSSASPSLGAGTPASSSATATGGSASVTPSPTAEGSPEQERDRVIEAALAELHARLVAPLTRDACLKDNPDRQPCIDLQSSPEQLTRGLAQFTGGDPDGGPFTFLMGRTADGDWRYWLGTRQMTYLLDRLPGQVLACGASTEVVVRDKPAESAGAQSSLKDLVEMTADRFVLTVPGSFGVSGTRGEGWYHIVSPVEGWVNATRTTAALLGDCLLHDEVEERPRG